MRGKVKWFNDDFGYGFITSNNIKKDIYVHYSELRMEGFKFLREEDIVEFDFDEKNYKATNVFLIKSKNKDKFQTQKN